MPISTTIQYIVIFAITIAFSSVALFIEENRIIMKIIAGFCWFIMGLLQFILGDVTSVVSIVFSMLFWLFGFMFFLSTTLDWFHTKKDRFSKGVME